jgi:hypothetical protein
MKKLFFLLSCVVFFACKKDCFSPVQTTICSTVEFAKVCGVDSADALSGNYFQPYQNILVKFTDNTSAKTQGRFYTWGGSVGGDFIGDFGIFTNAKIEFGLSALKCTPPPFQNIVFVRDNNEYLVKMFNVKIPNQINDSTWGEKTITRIVFL